MLDQQTFNSFIGRTREIKIFEDWLADPTSPWILYFHDALADPEKKGGIGKTWLLRKCIELTRERHPDIALINADFFNIDDRQGITIARQVIERLHELAPAWSPSTSLELFTEYSGSPEPNTELAAFRSRLSAALTADLHALDQLLHRSGRYVLLFFDTFELIEKNPVIASLDLTHVFPDNYQFEHIGAVIAGRNAIDWNDLNWKGRESEVRSVTIAPFSRDEMIAYMHSRAYDELNVHSNEAQQLYERTEGRPILIGLVADVLIYQATTLEELLDFPPRVFEARLVTKINDLVNPTNWIILFMAHAYHRFNVSLLDWILKKAHLHALVQEAQYEKILEDLLGLSFVRRSTTGNDFVLHDEMRKLVLKYCWSIQDTNRSYRMEISRSAISYYENGLVQKAKNDPLAQTYTIEMLYHKLYLDLETGLQELEKLFAEALDLWLTAYAHSLLQESELFFEEMSSGQRYRLLLLRAALLKQEEKSDLALEIYKQIETEADSEWLAVNQAALFYGLGDCLLELSRFSEAIDYLTKSQSLEKAQGNVEKSADILGLLGYICRRQGEQEQAVRYYQESIKGWKSIKNMREYANILNSLGYVFRLQGKIEDALQYCKLALSIREKLFNEEKAPQASIGFSHSTLGIVYHYNKDYTQAEYHFKQALEIYRRVGNNHGTMQMYHRFGQIEMSRDNLEKAREWFQVVEDSLIGTDLEVQTMNLMRQGLLYIKMGNYNDAIERFEKAHATASRMRDNFQIAESLIERGRATALAGDAESGLAYLDQGLELARNYRFYALLGRAEYLLGDINLKTANYVTAFTHYAQSCHYSALYNSVRFTSVRNDLNTILLNLPVTELPRIIETMLNYWHEQNLEEAYPELPNMCETLKLLPDYPVEPDS